MGGRDGDSAVIEYETFWDGRAGMARTKNEHRGGGQSRRSVGRRHGETDDNGDGRKQCDEVNENLFYIRGESCERAMMWNALCAKNACARSRPEK